MPKEAVNYIDGYLNITLQTGSVKIDPVSIRMIDFCHMEDEIYQGDEEFHILHCQNTFWLIGPFVDGALSAIDGLRAAYPDIPLRHTLVMSLPRKLRNPGFLGLRLFPIPGLGEFAISDLPPMTILKDDYHDRDAKF